MCSRIGIKITVSWLMQIICKEDLKLIYVTGDTHGYVTRFMPGKPDYIHDMTWGDDILIVTGDFGYIMKCDFEEELHLDYLAKKPYIICFCSGNHDNVPRINQYPEVEFCGAPVHKIRENIYHLKNGEIYTIEGKKFFVMGGAASTDKARRELYELEHGVKIWWEEEIPSSEELKIGWDNLKKNDFKVDIILSHTAPDFIVEELGYNPRFNEDYELTAFLTNVYHECKKDLKTHFFGHFHEDKELFGGVFRALLNDVVKIE